MKWKKATVISDIEHHRNYDAKRNNPPWTRVATCEDGIKVSFNWGNLCRNGTYEGNTRVGMIVWINERGAISYREPRA